MVHSAERPQCGAGKGCRGSCKCRGDGRGQRLCLQRLPPKVVRRRGKSMRTTRTQKRLDFILFNSHMCHITSLTNLPPHCHPHHQLPLFLHIPFFTTPHHPTAHFCHVHDNPFFDLCMPQPFSLMHKLCLMFLQD